MSTKNVNIPRTHTEIPNTTRQQLDQLKAEIEAEKNMEKKRKLQIQLAGLERFSRIQEGIDIDKNTHTAIQKILHNKNVETYMSSDLLSLRKKGIDIAHLTLVNVKNIETPVSSMNMRVNDAFIVNFGKNKDFHNRIGAGDILPPSIKSVTINGVQCTRNNTPRPGYYDTNGTYQPIYDGHIITILSIGKVNKEDHDANERQWRSERIYNMVENNDGKALTDLQEDIVLAKEEEKHITTMKNIRNSVGKTRYGAGAYGTNRPLSESVKYMSHLNTQESAGLARRIFGDGPATQLLIKLDGGKGAMIKRMIALGYHEGLLVFGRQNPDPASGYNIGTFQIGGRGSNPASSLKKYNDCLGAGVQLARSHGINIDSELGDPGQKDLMTHLGYINTQRGGDRTFDQLANANLSNDNVITLMHRTIQGGIRAIGESVVSQIANTKIDTSNLA